MRSAWNSCRLTGLNADGFAGFESVDRTLARHGRSGFERALRHSERSLVRVGVVMDREDSNGEYAAENAGPGPDRVAANHEMSSRMKQLLFGVRLSAGSAALEPASDLEDLARRLDMARAQRATRNGSSYD